MICQNRELKEVLRLRRRNWEEDVGENCVLRRFVTYAPHHIW
jgi:hypothetical protein